MRVMGIEALVPRPGTSKAAPGHKIYPYLLRGLKIVETNHVWAADVTYIPMACGFLYLVAIIDWASRAVLAWRLSNTNDASCARRRWRGAASFRKAADFQYRSGSTFTAEAFVGKLAATGVAISMADAAASWTTFSSNGCGARSSMKSASESLCRRQRGAAVIGSWMTFYNFPRPHQAMNNQMPMAVCAPHGQIEALGCGYAASLGQRKRVAHIPTAEAARSGLILEGQGQARSHLKSNVPCPTMVSSRTPLHSRLGHESLSITP